jgi:hypothetical protein
MNSFFALSSLAGAATLGGSPMPWRPSLGLAVLLSFVASAFMIVALGARPAQGWEWTILHIGGFELAFMLAAYAVGLLARWIYLRIR